MTTVRELHDKAMHLSQLALVARETGDKKRAIELAREALGYESQAAALVPDEKASEPTRSILYRSAATLAYQSKELQLSQQLLAKGLAGHPPARVEQELKALYEQVSFELHLQRSGVTLDAEELQMAMKGNAVGYGNIIYNEFIKRVEAFFSLVDRTVQRKMGRTYQRSGRMSQMYRPFTRVLSALDSGSFVVKLKLGQSDVQQHSFLFDSKEVISDIIIGMNLLNSGNEDGLRDLIPAEGYYQNFVALTREIVPDGEQIDFISISSSEGTLNLTRQRKEIQLVRTDDNIRSTSDRMPIKVIGILDHATSRDGDTVGLTTDDGRQFDITIREGFDDLVRSYFKKVVIVTGSTDGKIINPTDIQFSDNI